MENPFNKKIAWKQDGRTFGWGASPDADWKVIFLGTLLLIVMVGAWDVVTYLKVQSGELSQGETGEESPLPSLDRESLNAALDYYENKAAALEKIRDGKGSEVVDPSI